jgi:hypothetical protein
LKNIVFSSVKNDYPETYRGITLCFNDIDTYPTIPGLITDYSTVPGQVKHFYRLQIYFNAVILRGSTIERTTRLSSNTKQVVKKVADAAKLQRELDLKRDSDDRERNREQRASLTGTQELFFSRIQTEYQRKIED